MKLVKQRYIDRDTNIIQLCRQVLLYAGVRHTTWHLSKMASVRVEPFSLLAVQDILKSYGIDSIGVRLGDYQYTDFETPFVCALQRSHWPHPALAVVKEVSTDKVTFWNPEYKRMERLSTNEFRKIDKEIVLLLDDSSKQNEIDYEKNKKEENRRLYFRNGTCYVFCFLLFLAFFASFNTPVEANWLAPIFLVCSSFGLLLTSLLLWYEVDAFHPFLKEVCGGLGKKADCHAVLSSTGASFLGISWTALGFAFFASFFVTQFFFVAQPEGYYLLTAISLLVFPYVGYSLYYQSRVVRHFCPLCLFVQAILLLNALVSVYFLEQSPILFEEMHWSIVIPFGILFFGFLFLVHLAVPIIKEAKKSRDLEIQGRRL